MSLLELGTGGSKLSDLLSNKKLLESKSEDSFLKNIKIIDFEIRCGTLEFRCSTSNLKLEPCIFEMEPG